MALLLETTAAAGLFTTLVSALEAAGLAELLTGSGPWTLFAPTDEAFAKLPAAVAVSLRDDAPRLVATLRYHLVPARLVAADLMHQTSAPTLYGPALSFDVNAGIKVNNAYITRADIEAANGVIHAIDQVLQPPASHALQSGW